MGLRVAEIAIFMGRMICFHGNWRYPIFRQNQMAWLTTIKNRRTMQGKMIMGPSSFATLVASRVIFGFSATLSSPLAPICLRATPQECWSTGWLKIQFLWIQNTKWVILPFCFAGCRHLRHHFAVYAWSFDKFQGEINYKWTTFHCLFDCRVDPGRSNAITHPQNQQKNMRVL